MKKVYLKIEKKKIVVIDLSTGEKWANEFFDSVTEANQFCKDNHLKIINKGGEKPTSDEITQAQELLKRAGYLDCYWHRNDIIYKCKENGVKPTKKFVDEVMLSLERGFDATQGINWEIIDIHIDLTKND